MSDKDALGDRIKSQYEDRTRFMLPRRTYVLIRIDGKAFHSFTKDCKRPFDSELSSSMDITLQCLCEDIQGARLGYVQSDEMSLLLTDFEKPTTSAWFDNNLQKMVSVASSLATGFFNKIYRSAALAFFDARAFVISAPEEVENYFIWRQLDATRNSISMAARSVYSHKELFGKSSSEQQELLFQKNINWNDYPAGFKRGRVCTKIPSKKVIPMTGQTIDVMSWGIIDPPVFTQDRTFLRERIPLHLEGKWPIDEIAE